MGSDALIRTCPACGVDVSVPADLSDASCPRCAGPLTTPLVAEGDAPDRTLLEVRPDPSGASASVPSATTASSSRPPTEEESAPTLIEIPSGGSSSAPTYEETSTFGRLERRPVAAPLGPGQHLGGYELRRVLGKGGMGVVFEAYHPALERVVALKVMTSGDEGDEELERFEREARAAAKLKHPNIVPIFDVGEDAGRRFFTMDLVVGQTLTQRARAHELSPLESARTVAKVAHAIQYAHGQNIIHRDLKPSNIILDEQGEPHVTDFGLAKDLADVSGLTLTGVAMGSPPYMPPEQARGEFRDVDAVSDVYGLGAILYECLVGRPPFTGKSLYDVIAKVLVEDPEPPRKTSPEVPLDLETICLKALEKEKSRRYPSAQAMAQDLERFCAGQSIHAARRGMASRLGRLVQRHRGLLVAWLLPLLVTLSVLAHGYGGTSVPLEAAKDTRDPRLSALDPIAQVAHDLGDRLERAALDGVLKLIPDHGLPDARAAQAALAALAPDPRRDLERRLPPAGKVAPEAFAAAVRALTESRQVSDAALVVVLQTWLAAIDVPTARLVERVALAYRGSDQRQASTFALALRDPPTVLDLGVMRGAANRLQHMFEGRPNPRTLAVAAVTSDADRLARALGSWPQLEAEGVIRGRREDGSGWRFPAFAPDEERTPPLRHVLSREESERWLKPTRPLLTADGRRVAVGWLRFAFLLDAESGRVLSRARVPGLAEDLAYRPDGSFTLGVWDLHRDARREVRIRLAGDGLEVRDSDGSSLPAVELLPKSGLLAIDDQRRLAMSAFPEFDDLLVVKAAPTELAAPITVAARRLDLPAGRTIRLGFDQSNDGSLRLQHRIGVVSQHLDSSGRERPVLESRSTRREPQAGDWLHSFIFPPRRTQTLVLQLRAGGADGTLLVYRNTQAFPKLEATTLEQLALRANRLTGASDAPNPWILACGAAARAELARREGVLPPQDAVELALRASRARELLPYERVDLGCFLDAFGFEREADQAFTLALEALHLDFGFVPEWAGQGELDASVLISNRIAACLSDKRPDRAQVLRNWRARFAPAVSTAGAGASLAGLDLRGLLRFDEALMIRGRYGTSLVLLILVFMLLRHLRQSRRDLARIGAVTSWDRLALWWRQPLTRITFSLPCYVTRHERAALLLVYLLWFGAFAVQDAFFERLTAVRTAPQGALAGIPSEPATLTQFEAAFASAPRDRELAYARAWIRHATGHSQIREGYRDVLALGRDAPTLVGLAELLADKGELDRARELLAEAATLDPELVEVALLRSHTDGNKAEERRLRELIQTPRVRLCLEATGELPHPLAPPPARQVRDRALLGDSWAQRVPRLFVRDLLLPVPGSLDTSILEFERAWVSRTLDPRRQNGWIWMLAVVCGALFLSLALPAPRPLEPTAIDRRPGAARLLAPLWPGVAQLTTVRPVRGAVFLAVFMHLLGALYFHRSELTYVLSLRGDQVATLAGVDTLAVAGAVATHRAELMILLGLLYLLHWIDLANLRRSLARTADGTPTDTESSLLLVPIDTADSLLAGDSLLGATGAAFSGDRDGGPGLFDETRPELDPDLGPTPPGQAGPEQPPPGA